MKWDCCECGGLATWDYMPCGEREPALDYYCDRCVPRGCSCNIDDAGEEMRDEQGRLFPCCEYMYSAEGFTTRDVDDED